MYKTLAISCFFLASIGCGQYLDDLDNGMINVDGVELYENTFPVVVRYSEQIDDLNVVNEAISFWNYNLNNRQTKQYFDYQWFVDQKYYEGDYVDVNVNLAQVNPYEEDLLDLGKAEIQFGVDGLIYMCNITLSVDFAYDQRIMTEALKHELGHCLGLADDPGYPITVDLNSIMGSPLNYRGELTDHDFDLVVNRYFEGR